jgi:hypothetical protein
MRPARSVIAVSLTLLASLSAPADIVVSHWNGDLDYRVKLTHVPDLDQRRDDCCGSPGFPNDGAMYCVPTSTMNLFAYAANHGFSYLAPGAGNWQSDSLYDEATDAIAELAGYMGTSGTGGTDGSGQAHGSWEWLSLYSLGLLTRTTSFLDLNNDPSMRGMALKNLAGGVVAFCYGRYEITGSFDGWPLLNRTGGHCVSFVEAERNDTTRRLRYRDPADDSTDATQSPFISQEVGVTRTKVAFFAHEDWVKWCDVLDNSSGDGKLYIIDGYVTVQPLSFLSFTEMAGTYFLDQTVPYLFTGSLPPPPAIDLGSVTDVVEVAFEIDGGANGLALVQDAGPKLRRFNLIDGTSADVPLTEPIQRFVVGRNGRIYAHDGSKLYCFRPDGSLAAATSNIPTPTALAYDDVNDHVIVLGVPQRVVRRLSANLATVSTFLVPQGSMAGDATVIVNPVDQHVLFCTEASSQVFEVAGLGAPFTFALHTVPGLVTPQCLGASDTGDAFASTPAGLRVLHKMPAGNWIVDSASPLHDLDITGPMASLRSRSNADPVLHGGPAWMNIPPSELPDLGAPVEDCRADADGDDAVGFGDLLFLLSDWGAAGGAADVDGDGVVGFPDLLIVLASWGPCA